MSKGVTVDLIVDPKGAIQGIGAASNEAGDFTKGLAELGKIGVGALAALGTAALGIVTGLTAATKSAGEYAENVQNAASKTHLTTDAVQELQYASKITGVEFSTISGSLTRLTKNLGLAESGNAKTADAFAQLGVATTNADGSLRDSTAVYSDVISALGQISNPTERDVIAMQLLGKSATELNPLIDGSAGSIADLAQQAHDAGAVLNGDMLNGLGNVDDAFDKLAAGTDAAKNALGLVLMPALQELGDTGSGLLGDFTNAVVNANGDLSKAAPEIGKVVADAASFLLGQIPAFLEVGTSIITSILEGVATQGPAIITAAIPILADFVTTLLGQLPMLLDAGIKILVALAQGVSAALPTLIPAAVAAVVGLVTTLIDNLPLLIDAGLQLLVGLETGLIAALPQLLDAIPDVIEGLVGALVGAIPALIVAGVQLFVALVENLPAIIEGIVKAVPAIGKALVDAFTDPKFLKGLVDAGVQMVKGIWQGIKSMGDWLWNMVSGFFGGLLDQIKDFLGIHSPSAVFAEMGQFMVRGLEVGLSGPNKIGALTSDLSRQVTSGFAGSLDVQARAAVVSGGGLATGGGMNVNVTVNGYVGSPDQLARNLKTVLVDGIRSGAISADWEKK